MKQSLCPLSVDQHCPLFSPAAVKAGLAAVFTFPLRDGDGRLGALDLYRDSIGELTEREMITAQTMADVVAAYLINAQAREQATVAEGVETEIQRDQIANIGCDSSEGFYFARPMAASAIGCLQWLPLPVGEPELVA